MSLDQTIVTAGPGAPLEGRVSDLERRVSSLQSVQGFIGEHSIDAGEHLAVGSVTTGALAAGSVTAAIIAANAVQAGHLEAILTIGTTIQTDLTNPKVKLDSSGIFGYNSGGTEVFRVNTDTGSVAIAGTLTAGVGSALPITYLTSGSLVTGTVFRLDSGGYFETSPTNPRVVIDSAGWRSYNASGVLTTEITNSTAIFQGATFRTGPTSGARVQMDSLGLHAIASDGVTKSATLTASGGLDLLSNNLSAGEWGDAVRDLTWVHHQGGTPVLRMAGHAYNLGAGAGTGTRSLIRSDGTATVGTPAGSAALELQARTVAGDAASVSMVANSAGDLSVAAVAGSHVVVLADEDLRSKFFAASFQSSVRVGGTGAAAYTLDVLGDVGVTGTLFWSGDTNLYRNAAGVLKTDSYLMSAIELVARHNGAGQVQIGNAGPAGQAGLQLGSAGDVNLYRLAAGSLASSSHLTVGRFAAAGAAIDGTKPVIVGTNTSSGNGAHLTNGGTWTNVSTVAAKTGFAPMLDVRARLRGLLIREWRYKDTDERHIGPTAEAFAAAFGTVGTDPRGLAAMDVAGVALLAAKEQDRELEALRADVAAIRSGLTPAIVAALERLDRRLAAIERVPAVAQHLAKSRS